VATISYKLCINIALIVVIIMIIIVVVVVIIIIIIIIPCFCTILSSRTVRTNSLPDLILISVFNPRDLYYRGFLKNNNNNKGQSNRRHRCEVGFRPPNPPSHGETSDRGPCLIQCYWDHMSDECSCQMTRHLMPFGICPSA